MVVANGQHALGKSQHGGGLFFFQHGPVHPCQLVVLAVDVIISVLGAAELIAVREHRSALGE